MTTFTLTGYTFDGLPFESAATDYDSTTLEIVAEDDVDAFTYLQNGTFDFGAGGVQDIVFSAPFVALRVDGIDYFDVFNNQNERITIQTWTNVATLDEGEWLAFYDPTNDMSYVYRLSGSNFPSISSVQELNDFFANLDVLGNPAPGSQAGEPIELAGNPALTFTEDDFLQGTEFNDNLGEGIGLSDDTINGDAGDDTILGGVGNDLLRGGAGNDTILGGDDNDTIYGDSGADSILGGNGDDDIWVEDALDTIDGGAGTDDVRLVTAGLSLSYANWSSIERIFGTGGNDTVDASAATGAVTISGANGADNLIGGSEADLITGGGGADSLSGGGKQDFIFGGAGNDTMIGGGGNDFFYVDSAGDVVIGDVGTQFTGTNRVRFENDSGLSVSLAYWVAVSRVDGGAGADAIDGSSYTTDLILIGEQGSSTITGGNDTLTGGSGNDVIFGKAGNDNLTGNGGNDVLVGDSGNDTMNGGAGDDVFFVADAGDVVTGGAGLDRVRVDNAVSGINLDTSGWSGVERFSLSSGNDTLDASSQGVSLSINGQGGSDSIIGGSAGDLLFGNTGADTLIGGGGNDSMWGDAGNDIFFGGAGDDFFFIADAGDRVADGGVGFDRVTLTKAGMSVSITGAWAGIERVDGVAGSETIDATGYTGALTMVGNAGADSLTGGSANDVIFGNDGADVISGGAGGNDVMLGGTGADVFVFDALSGTDQINDWEDGTDLIDVSALGVTNILGFTITDTGTNIEIDLGVSLVTLQGATGDTIDINDFILI